MKLENDCNNTWIDSGFSESARCTNAGAFVHKTSKSSKVDRSIKLVKKITIRVSDPFYKKMEKWLEQSNCQSLAELARSIIYKEKIIWYHKSSELESTAIELAAIRKELNAIGKNINQITHYFHGTDIPNRKMFHALKVADEYKKVGNKVDLLLKMVSEISKTWLQK